MFSDELVTKTHPSCICPHLSHRDEIDKFVIEVNFSMTKRALLSNRRSSVTKVYTSQDITKFITKGNATWRGPCWQLAWLGVTRWQMTWRVPGGRWRGIGHSGRWRGFCHIVDDVASATLADDVVSAMCPSLALPRGSFQIAPRVCHWNVFSSQNMSIFIMENILIITKGTKKCHCIWSSFITEVQ